MKYIKRNLEKIVMEMTNQFLAIMITGPRQVGKTANPGTELTKVFRLLDKASEPRDKGAIICMKQMLSAVDKDNYIIPIWMI